MMKTIIFFISILVTIETQAQFLRGIGIFGGVTTSRHRYINTSAVDTLYSHKIPSPSHKSAEFINWSAGLNFELLRFERFRWLTEFEYCNKGAVENPDIAPTFDQRSGKKPNKLTYIEWNNYAKFFLNEGNRGIPYVMLGARLEYLFQRSATAYPTVIGALPKISVSPDAAIGYEFITYGKLKPFVELHYNPDVMKKSISNIRFDNRTWELKVGLMFRPKQKALDDCNAPRYHGNY